MRDIFLGLVQEHTLSINQGVCVECGEVVESKSLRGHLESRHYTNLKNKLCQTCGKAFRIRSDLEVHMAMVHEQNKQSVICHVCGKDLPHPKLLARVSSSAADCKSCEADEKHWLEFES